VRNVEAPWRRPNAVVREFRLTAPPMVIDLTGAQTTTRGYGTGVPRTETRIKAGGVVP